MKSFSEWKQDKCPHKNRDFCREYNLFINGKRDTPPKIEDYEKKPVSTGHYHGPRSSKFPDKHDKINARKPRSRNQFDE